jgi:hypothetical protein
MRQGGDRPVWIVTGAFGELALRVLIPLRSLTPPLSDG